MFHRKRGQDARKRHRVHRSESMGLGNSTRLALCDSFGNAAIVGILFFAPLVMGGRHPVGKLIYLGLVGTFAVAWLVRQSFADKAEYRSHGIGWLLGAAISLVLLQLIPLPAAVVHALSPFQTELLPLWSEAAVPVSLGAWSRLSLAPFSTREGLVTLLTHVTLFTIAVQWLRDWQHVARLLRMIAGATIAMAAFGFLQYLSHTPKFAWVFSHPSRDASRVLCGPFANSNHFSHFLALGIGPVLWCLQESLNTRTQKQNRPRPMYGRPMRNRSDHMHLVLIAGLALIATGGLLAQSRGGIIVLFTATTLGVGLFSYYGLFGPKSLVAVLVAGLFVAIAVGIHGKEEIASELATMTSIENIDKSESRRNIWRANLRAAQKFSICGAGVGSHDEIYRRFYPHPSSVEYTHAESGFLQVLTETGLPGLGIVVLCIGVCLRWIWTVVRHVGREQIGLVIAVTVSLVVSGLHSVFDFVWFLPACMSVTVLIAAVTCRMAQLTIVDIAGSPHGDEPLDGVKGRLVDRRRKTDSTTQDDECDPPKPPVNLLAAESTFPRVAWLAFAASVLAMFVALGSWQWPVAHASLSWNRYLRLSLAKKPPRTIVEEVSETAEARSNRLERERLRSQKKTEQMIQELETTLERFPDHPRANIRLAGFRIQMFEKAQLQSDNAMPLDQIRDAAYASLKVAPEKVDAWLSSALGENRNFLQDALRYARTGVANSPLLGRGYLFLSQVAFVEGYNSDCADQLVEQAYVVRPYSGSIWLSMGEAAFLKGELDQAFHFRRKAFHQDAECRDAIINGLAGQMPVTAFLQQFTPDEAGLRSLLRFYMTNNQEADASVAAGFLGDYTAQRAQKADGAAAASYWVKATLLYRMSGDTAQTLLCAATAATASPNSVRVRRTYATELFQQKLWEKAVPELRWCINRNPADRQVKRMLATATRIAHRDGRHQDNSPRSR